jgi:hypothetical protein
MLDSINSEWAAIAAVAACVAPYFAWQAVKEYE